MSSSELEYQLSRKTAETEELAIQLTAVKNTRSRQDRLIAQLEDDLARAKSSDDDMRQQCRLAKRECDSLRQKLQNLDQTSARDLQEVMAAFDTREAQIITKLRQAQHEAKTAKTELRDQRFRLNEAAQSDSVRVRQLEAKLAESDAAQGTLRDQVALNQIDRGNVRRSSLFSNVSSEKEDWKLRCQQARAELETYRPLKARNRDLKDELAAVQALNKKQSTRNDDLAQQLQQQAASTATGTGNITSQEYQRLQTALSEARRKNALLKDRNSALELASMEITDDSERQDLRKENIELQQELRDLAESLTGLQLEVIRLSNIEVKWKQEKSKADRLEVDLRLFKKVSA